jgi:hypothetical protein
MALKATEYRPTGGRVVSKLPRCTKVGNALLVMLLVLSASKALALAMEGDAVAFKFGWQKKTLQNRFRERLMNPPLS